MSVPGWWPSLVEPWPAPAQIGAGAAVFLVAVMAASALRTAARGRVRWTDLGPLRTLGWGPAAATMLLTALVAAAFSAVPVLRWGWWPALGGWGSAALGVHAAFPDPWRLVVAAACSGCLLWAIPTAALAEERAWRVGTAARSRTRRALRAVAFGVLHLLSGVPVAVAVALVVPGLRFTHVTARAVAAGADEEQALRRAAGEHAAYNVLAVLIALVIAAT